MSATRKKLNALGRRVLDRGHVVETDIIELGELVGTGQLVLRHWLELHSATTPLSLWARRELEAAHEREARQIADEYASRVAEDESIA